ncbi:hypothetical protein [Ruania zhangjianzhongii]|uniref:hypothetical protein n=1 Tax=Ruania zhangjianzhongii TaxID=2603206 RepID=UPI0011CAFF43|nr:hypothetical protein [Ruania zhangjianzhongii]
MRGVGHGKHRDRHEDADRPGEQETPPEPGEPVPHWEAHTARGGYLGGAYPSSPPPAEAPASGPDEQSADPYYQRPEYPTDPGGIALPDLTGEVDEAPPDERPGPQEPAGR